MKRLFWISVGAAAAVLVIRKAGDLIERHTPPGVAHAAGVVSGLSGVLRTARTEFTAGFAEREAELRHDLLGDVDLDEARTRTDAWRAGRGDSTRRRPSRGSPRTAGGVGRHPDDSAELAQDDDDGDLGYSFY